MVVLVRCHDNSFAPALESCINELVSKGLISGFLSNGKWIEVARKQSDDVEQPLPKRQARRLMAACY